MNKNKKKGFTLVELLAVIVILAIILVIAVPKIMTTIKKAKIGSMESSAKLIAKSIETNYQVSLASGEGGTLSLTGSCLDSKLVDIDLNEYESCTYTITNGKAKVTLIGKDSGKFSGLVCTDATKTTAECGEEIITYATSGESLARFNVTNVSNCTAAVRPILSNYMFGDLYDNLIPAYQTLVDEYVYDTCNTSFPNDGIWMPMEFLNAGTVSQSTLDTFVQLDYYQNSTETLSKNYISKMSLTKTNINSISFVKTSNFNPGTLTGIDISQVNDGSVMGYFDSTTGELFIVSNDITYFPEDSSNLFSDMTKLSSITFNNISTAKVVNMNYMFDDCELLSEIDLSNFNTSKVTGMKYMFNNCKTLEEIDLTKFNTSKVTGIRGMFMNCIALENIVNLNKIDTSKVWEFNYMFGNCTSLTEIDVSNFNTSSAKSFAGLFYNCNLITELDLSSFDTKNVNYMYGMFEGCSSLKSLDLSKFDTSKVIMMSYLFEDCTSLETLDISSFNFSKVVKAVYMFKNCPKLTTTLTINNDIEYYDGIFYNAATESDTQITIKGTNEYKDTIDAMIATGSGNITKQIIN